MFNRIREDIRAIKERDPAARSSRRSGNNCDFPVKRLFPSWHDDPPATGFTSSGEMSLGGF